MNLQLSAIYVYPVKSLGGFAVDATRVEERGLQHDRRWMLVDADNNFLTQRNHPQMALLQVSLPGDALVVTHKHTLDQISIPQKPETSEMLRVKVWSDTCRAVAASPKADAWFSNLLGQPCRLVYMPDTTKRRVDARYAVADNHTGFSDGYPFLIIGQASLDDLNDRLAEPLPMNRFRPNLVVGGGEPYAEDDWHEIQVGETTFFGVKPCGRCIVTATDQKTGEIGREPLKTLAAYRKRGNKILFGQNMVFGRTGDRISVGDAVRVHSLRAK